jgi:hypothetical protein
LAGGGWQLHLVVTPDDGEPLDVRVFVDDAERDLVLGDVPEDRLWPAVARYALRFELPPLANDGRLVDGVVVPISAPRGAAWARDERVALVPLTGGALIGELVDIHD